VADLSGIVMKSNKQRRAEVKAKRAARLAAWARGVAVDRSRLAPDGSYSQPAFVSRGTYVDQPFDCQECGKSQIWTATQQRWWYEVAKGNVWTTARLCRPCRRRERARQEEARRVHLEGVARKRHEDT
jgi:hypothetical protein